MLVRAPLPLATALRVLATMKSISTDCKCRSIADAGRAVTRKQPVGQISVQPPLQKYFVSPVGQIISTNSRHPTPPEGRIAIVTDAGCGCGGRGSVLRATGSQGGSMRPVSDHQASGREMLQRTAKSCGPDAPMLASSSRSCVGPTGLRQNLIRGRRWQTSPVTGESTKETVKTIACGNAG